MDAVVRRRTVEALLHAATVLAKGTKLLPRDAEFIEKVDDLDVYGRGDWLYFVEPGTKKVHDVVLKRDYEWIHKHGLFS